MVVQFIDFSVEFPEEVAVTEVQISPSRRLFVLSPGSRTLQDEICAKARRVGFERTTGNESPHYLGRGRQVIWVYEEGNDLKCDVRDPTLLPRAQLEDGIIGIGAIRLTLGLDITIEPGREEKHSDHRFKASWRVYGLTAEELNSRLFAGLTELGFKITSAFAPPRNGIRRWSSKAYAPTKLMAIRVYEETEGLRLDLDLTC